MKSQQHVVRKFLHPRDDRTKVQSRGGLPVALTRGRHQPGSGVTQVVTHQELIAGTLFHGPGSEASALARREFLRFRICRRPVDQPLQDQAFEFEHAAGVEGFDKMRVINGPRHIGGEAVRVRARLLVFQVESVIRRGS